MIQECISFVKELITPIEKTDEEILESTQVLTQQDEMMEEPIQSSALESFSCPSESWGVLYALPGPNIQFDHLFLDKDETVLGMKDFKSIDRTISSAHLKFIFDRATGGCTVKDISMNGTYLNGFKLSTGVAVPIKSGDSFSLAISESRPDSVAFCFYKIKMHNLLQDQVVSAVVPKLLDPNHRINVVYNELLCKICDKLPYNSIGFYPCGHTFCGNCILYSGTADTRRCPKCHADIKIMSRNHLLDLVVQTYRSMNPSRIEREDTCLNFAATIDEMLCRFAKTSTRIPARHVKKGRFISCADKKALSCRRCPERNISSTDTCGPSTVHYECKACKLPFPSPSDEATITCAFCHGKFCSVVFGCASPDLRGAIGPLVMVHPYRQPRSWAWGNSIESEIIRLAVDESGLSLKQIYLRIVYLLFNRDILWEKSRLHGWGISPSSYGCRDCVSDIVLPELFFLCRHLVQTHTLGCRPYSVPDCPKGRDCHIQHASLEHRENFNHYCLPNPYAKEGRIF
ncbi:hypothetical protein DSO57_1006201 [Entomophthora muscae]|uniref:Uncharacterized protein n=1 Tax=Entomophthora muscae TaxID=34485 RepID=A0ACC2S9U5_9FUNG|nr:hypothetical protein DSO57_1006201 [Entomophthora muscae]